MYKHELLWVDEMLRNVYVKEKHNLHKIIIFFIIWANLKKFK